MTYIVYYLFSNIKKKKLKFLCCDICFETLPNTVTGLPNFVSIASRNLNEMN
uniref:Uncharacterized protein n=1 Tax=Gloeochaete wittrockiana TaxID=38269 RepID=A0A3G1IVZ8_9EUKA|nr:hypothetical protein [Gloeochaete wittrockiana]ASQ40211.1 hypothetical protein [Gloeochaete wittrockiana]